MVSRGSAGRQPRRHHRKPEVGEGKETKLWEEISHKTVYDNTENRGQGKKGQGNTAAERVTYSCHDWA